MTYKSIKFITAIHLFMQQEENEIKHKRIGLQ